MNFNNKIIILTGASGGIGEALAHRFLQANPKHLLLLDLNLGALEKTKAKLAFANTSVQMAECDVSDAAQIQQHVSDVEQRVGSVDIFCSNAGVFKTGGADADIADWQLSLNVNAMAHVYAAQACLPMMLKRKSGYFLQIISAAGLLSQIGSAPYTVSKHAALGFAEWLAITHGEQGIGVTAVCPQGVDTAMLDSIDNPDSVSSSGIVTPEAVAECAVTAMQDEQFLALPHPEVATYYQHKASDTDRWIKSMQRFQAHISK